MRWGPGVGMGRRRTLGKSLACNAPAWASAEGAILEGYLRGAVRVAQIAKTGGASQNGEPLQRTKQAA